MVLFLAAHGGLVPITFVTMLLFNGHSGIDGHLPHQRCATNQILVVWMGVTVAYDPPASWRSFDCANHDPATLG